MFVYTFISCIPEGNEEHKINGIKLDSKNKSKK
jgi:hypothetical protein